MPTTEINQFTNLLRVLVLAGYLLFIYPLLIGLVYLTFQTLRGNKYKLSKLVQGVIYYSTLLWVGFIFSLNLLREEIPRLLSYAIYLSILVFPLVFIFKLAWKDEIPLWLRYLLLFGMMLFFTYLWGFILPILLERVFFGECGIGLGISCPVDPRFLQKIPH